VAPFRCLLGITEDDNKVYFRIVKDLWEIRKEKLLNTKLRSESYLSELGSR
jgi:predicted transcriptional regulator